MEDRTVFEQLVTDLSSNERKDLLGKLQDGGKEISSEPLKTESEESRGSLDFKHEYKRLNLFQKLFVLLKQFFSGKSQNDVIQNMLLKRLMDKTQNQTSGLVNFNTRMFLPLFNKELISLNDQLVKIRAPFQKALGEDRKEFFAFFISLELETLNERLVEELDPYRIFDDMELSDPSEVKEEMNRRFLQILGDMKEDEKNKILHHTFSLHYFNKLCFFNFETLISRFGDTSWGGPGNLTFQAASKDLVRLLDLLQSASYPPVANTIEAVILYYYHDAALEEEEEIDDVIKRSVKQVNSAFATIRQFNKKIPLLNIVRCITKNLNYSPKRIQGGDDWYVLFKKFWEEQISKNYKEFYATIKVKTFMMRARDFLSAAQFPELMFYNSNVKDRFPFRYVLSLGFVSGFAVKHFAGVLNKSLKILLLQGDFFKQENRTELTDSFNSFSTLANRITKLDRDLAPDGELGAKLDRVHREIIKGNLQQKHLIKMISEVDKQAWGLVSETLQNTFVLINILNGVLHGKMGGKYDSISNLKRVGGKSNTEVLGTWKLCLNILHKALDFLKEITALENKTN